MGLLAANSEFMGWDELARALLQSLIEEHGGLIAATVFHGLVSTFLLLISWVYFIWILRKKDKEIDRKSDQNKELQDVILKHRISSSEKKHRVK